MCQPSTSWMVSSTTLSVLGRRRIYGFEVLVLAAGAIASALAPTLGWLLLFRFILGLGIGGDYPVSATIMSEYAGKRTRGLVAGVAMQAAGLIVGPVLALVFLSTSMSHELTWRLLLGLGAVPGRAVFLLRRQIQETPRYQAAHPEAPVVHGGQDQRRASTCRSSTLSLRPRQLDEGRARPAAVAGSPTGRRAARLRPSFARLRGAWSVLGEDRALDDERTGLRSGSRPTTWELHKHVGDPPRHAVCTKLIQAV